MNPGETIGRLASGRTFRATGYLLDVNEESGEPTARVDAAEMVAVLRTGTLVTLQRRKGGPLRLEGATIDDAGRLELALRAMLPVKQQQGRGALKMLAMGCGGLLALAVVGVIVLVVAVAVGGGAKKSGPKHNIVAYAPGTTAQTSELALTLQSIDDPFTSGNQFIQPGTGNRFIRFHVVAKDVDTRDHTVNDFSFKLTTSDHHTYDPTISLDGFKAFSLSAGQITEGDIVFEAPAGASVAELKYDNGLGSDDLFWRP